MRTRLSPARWWRTILCVVALFTSPCTVHATSFTTPGSWSYTVPAGVYAVSVTLVGAGGGGGGADAYGGGNGGNGGSISAIVAVQPGQTLSGYVGGGGATGWTSGNGGSYVYCSGNGSATAGGGGAGGAANCPNSSVGGYSGGGGAGGGASSLALAGTYLLQAAGGGGGGGGTEFVAGASGGSVSGLTQTALCATLGTGGTGASSVGDGGGGGGGGGGYIGGAGGAYEDDTARISPGGGGAGQSCYSTSSAVVSASASVGASAAGGVPGGNSFASSYNTGANGSVTVSAYASFTFAKSSSVIRDPVNGTSNPKSLPGATVQYCVLLTNTGPNALGGVSFTDAIPTQETFVAGSLYTGTTCTTATTAQANPSPATSITISPGAIANGASYAVVYEVTIN
jgi:uncharacterized repeat protein (TIGR01451 family)